MTNENSKIKNNILEKIKHGEVSMRPRWHFVLETILVVSGMVLLAMGLLYLLSFIVFFFRQSGLFFTPLFGFHGIITFLYASPWLLIFVAIVFIGALEVLVRKYSFGYRTPLLYILFGIVGISFLGTYVLAQTPIHARLQMYTNESRIPFVAPLYKKYGEHKLPNVHMGIISEVTEDGFVLNDVRKGIYTVRLTKDTRIPYGVTFKKEMVVGVMGTQTHGEIIAEGVRPLHEEGIMPHMRSEMKREHMNPLPEVRGRWKGMK